MTNLRQKPITDTRKGQRDWSLRSLEVEANDEYLPMDVFLDPRTIKEHFQYSTVRIRMRIH